MLQVTKASQYTLSSPSSLAEEKVSDLESILDTPRKSALKKYVRKITLEKQKFINKNRNLKKQNRRLQKKIANMSAILNQVKKEYLSEEQFAELNLNKETLSLLSTIVCKKRSKKC